MTILNKDALYYLGTPWSGEPYKEIRNDTFVWQSYEDSTEQFYCYEFGNAEAFTVFPLDTLLTPEQINQIRTGEASLAISNSHEAFHYVVPVLYQNLAIQYNIPPEHIILISESADIASHIKRVSSELSMGEFRSRWLRRFEYDIQINRFIMSFDGLPFVNGLPGKKLPDTITLENKHYDKKFLCFNRRWRGHRTVLVSLLHALDLLKYGHVSLGRSDDNRDWHSATSRGKYFMDNHPEALALLDSVQEELLAFPELYLDNEDLITNRALLDASTNYLYSETYFSVVTETFFFRKERPDEYGRFLSEKTFKPVAMKHPFIIVSTPNFLVKFKELGYKSFSPWINEDYDNENDDATRMMMILKEIERLSTLSDTELEQFLTAIRDICEHNYKILTNKKLHEFYMDL